MAKKLFPDTDAVGQHIRYTQPPHDGSPNDIEIVGVVNSHRHDVQSETLNRRLFVPLAQGYTGSVFLNVRLATKDRTVVLGLIPTLREALRNLDPDFPILTMAPFSDLMERSVGLWIVRLGAILFGVFGGIALLLAVVGVYGVKAYAVARRTREIGIAWRWARIVAMSSRLIMKQGALQTASPLGLVVDLARRRSRPRADADKSVRLTRWPLLPPYAARSGGVLACFFFFPCSPRTRVSPMTALRTE